MQLAEEVPSDGSAHNELVHVQSQTADDLPRSLATPGCHKSLEGEAATGLRKGEAATGPLKVEATREKWTLHTRVEARSSTPPQAPSERGEQLPRLRQGRG